MIAAASCVIGSRLPLVESHTSACMMKETKQKTEAEGANLFVWIVTDDANEKTRGQKPVLLRFAIRH